MYISRMNEFREKNRGKIRDFIPSSFFKRLDNDLWVVVGPLDKKIFFMKVKDIADYLLENECYFHKSYTSNGFLLPMNKFIKYAYIVVPNIPILDFNGKEGEKGKVAEDEFERFVRNMDFDSIQYKSEVILLKRNLLYLKKYRECGLKKYKGKDQINGKGDYELKNKENKVLYHIEIKYDRSASTKNNCYIEIAEKNPKKIYSRDKRF